MALDLLSRGMPVYSVDTSAATDRFPRKVSTAILRFLGGDDYAAALEELCEKPLHFPYRKSNPEIYMSVGQPMGLYSSFPLFTLSNIAVARTATLLAYVYSKDTKGPNLQLFKNNTGAQVLGDDVLFSDGRIAAYYTQIMTRVLGVEVSAQKSFSGRVGEFAGFIMVPTNRGICAFRPYKFPEGDSMITNPLEFLHAIGSKVRKLKRQDYWSSVWETFSKTQSYRDISLSPLWKFKEDTKFAPGEHQLTSHSAVALATLIGRALEESGKGEYPPVSSNSKINRIPLFHEQSNYVEATFGYNPRDYREFDKHRRDVYMAVSWTLSKDPLMNAVMKGQMKNETGKQAEADQQVGTSDRDWSKQSPPDSACYSTGQPFQSSGIRPDGRLEEPGSVGQRYAQGNRYQGRSTNDFFGRTGSKGSSSPSGSSTDRPGQGTMIPILEKQYVSLRQAHMRLAAKVRASRKTSRPSR
jgi:hypothetical protein